MAFVISPWWVSRWGPLKGDVLKVKSCWKKQQMKISQQILLKFLFGVRTVEICGSDCSLWRWFVDCWCVRFAKIWGGLVHQKISWRIQKLYRLQQSHLSHRISCGLENQKNRAGFRVTLATTTTSLHCGLSRRPLTSITWTTCWSRATVVRLVSLTSMETVKAPFSLSAKNAKQTNQKNGRLLWYQ